MSSLLAEDALELVFSAPMEEIDSGGELDIEEDPDFPLPIPHEDICSESESEPSMSEPSESEPSETEPERESEEASDAGKCMSKTSWIHV